MEKGSLSCSMLSLNDNNAWYYPSHGHDSDDEQLTKYSENGNRGKKHMKGAIWVRRGKMTAWGLGLDDWEVSCGSGAGG